MKINTYSVRNGLGIQQVAAIAMILIFSTVIWITYELITTYQLLILLFCWLLFFIYMSLAIGTWQTVELDEKGFISFKGTFIFLKKREHFKYSDIELYYIIIGPEKIKKMRFPYSHLTIGIKKLDESKYKIIEGKPKQIMEIMNQLKEKEIPPLK